MPALKRRIGKPQTLKTLDAFSHQRAHVDVEPILRMFRSRTTNLVDIAKTVGLIRTEAEERHLREHLLNEGKKGWWQHVQPIEPIVRQAFLKTAELVSQLDLPVDSYWVCSGEENTAPFEASISVSPQQITLMFHTPRPPASNRNQVDDVPIWIVSRDRHGKVTTKSVGAALRGKRGRKG